MYWQTADGKRILINDLEHSHISNIFYFFKIFKQGSVNEHVHKVLDQKYNGEILPYEPKYIFEVEYLFKNGLLKMKNDICLIIFEGKKIGTISKKFLKEVMIDL